MKLAGEESVIKGATLSSLSCGSMVVVVLGKMLALMFLISVVVKVQTKVSTPHGPVISLVCFTGRSGGYFSCYLCF